MAKNDKKSEPMDTNIRERSVGEIHQNMKRTCHAIKQLVAEVAELFPETPVEYSNYDGRNTALGVTFDLTVHDNDEAITLCQLLGLVETDERVEQVIVEDQQGYVLIKSHPLTQDSRDSFGLADTYEVLTDGDESNWIEVDPADPFNVPVRGSW